MSPGNRPSTAAARVESLDGLRGIAALLVVVFHCMLVRPSLADVMLHQRPLHGWASALSYTPLRLLWAGEEAVLIFFVLSGAVLTLPFRERRFDPVAYYPRRLVRLYLPVWGSILLALAWAAVVPRSYSPDASWWVNGHAFHLTLRGLGGDGTLVIGTTWLNSVLWSLKWEVWFSLLLPLFLLVLVRHRRGALVKAAVLLAAVQLGVAVGHDSLRYLPIFGIGVLLGAHLERVRSVVGRLGGWNWVVLAGGLLVLAESRWLTGGGLLSAASVAAAVVLIALFAAWGPAMALGVWPPVRWLGRVSFSLYLVHEPIVTSTALMTGSHDPVVVLAIALPAALVVAALFHRVVEVPAHRLSRVVGRGLHRAGSVEVADAARGNADIHPIGRRVARDHRARPDDAA